MRFEIRPLHFFLITILLVQVFGQNENSTDVSHAMGTSARKFHHKMGPFGPHKRFVRRKHLHHRGIIHRPDVFHRMRMPHVNHKIKIVERHVIRKEIQPRKKEEKGGDKPPPPKPENPDETEEEPKEPEEPEEEVDPVEEEEGEEEKEEEGEQEGEGEGEEEEIDEEVEEDVDTDEDGIDPELEETEDEEIEDEDLEGVRHLSPRNQKRASKHWKRKPFLHIMSRNKKPRLHFRGRNMKHFVHAHKGNPGLVQFSAGATTTVKNAKLPIHGQQSSVQVMLPRSTIETRRSGTVGLEGEEGALITHGANRPPDIIIRNTFKSRPKSWIDLRITIDENGILNVEAGPQGITTDNSTSTSAEATDNTIPLTRTNQNQVVQTEQPQHNLNSHWSGNEMHPKKTLFSHAHGLRHHPSHMGHKKPFWRLNRHSYPHHFQHGVLIGHRHHTIGPKLPEPAENPSKIEAKPKAPQVPSGPTLDETVNQMIAENATEPAKAPEVTPKESSPLSVIDEEVNIDDESTSGCPPVRCMMACPGGLFKLDLKSGCPLCECCPSVNCRMSCPHGYKSDIHGCPICRCVKG